jgi:hypothetical protein
MATSKTTKRTTATRAYDVEGNTIRLLKTKLTSHGGHNTLMYEAVRQAFKRGNSDVPTFVRGYDDGPRYRDFGVVPMPSLEWLYKDAISGVPYFRIGCHVFTLKMFNRVLRAAGVHTTKPQTLKTFTAAAGR